MAIDGLTLSGCEECVNATQSTTVPGYRTHRYRERNNVVPVYQNRPSYCYCLELLLGSYYFF